jgi:hypothetical protein
MSGTLRLWPPDGIGWISRHRLGLNTHPLPMRYRVTTAVATRATPRSQTMPKTPRARKVLHEVEASTAASSVSYAKLRSTPSQHTAQKRARRHVTNERGISPAGVVRLHRGSWITVRERVGRVLDTMLATLLWVAFGCPYIAASHARRRSSVSHRAGGSFGIRRPSRRCSRSWKVRENARVSTRVSTESTLDDICVVY